jgi:hypothetical protein
MTGRSGPKDPPHSLNGEKRAPGEDVFSGLGERERRAVPTWVGENLTEERRSVYGQRILYWTLGIGFVVGLAAHVGGYALRLRGTTEPLGLLADLLYTLGWALWTGVVVVVFLQIIPEVKRRQIKQALDAYEAALRDVRDRGAATAVPPSPHQPEHDERRGDRQDSPAWRMIASLLAAARELPLGHGSPLLPEGQCVHDLRQFQRGLECQEQRKHIPGVYGGRKSRTDRPPRHELGIDRVWAATTSGRFWSG